MITEALSTTNNTHNPASLPCLYSQPCVIPDLRFVRRKNFFRFRCVRTGPYTHTFTFADRRRRRSAASAGVCPSQSDDDFAANVSFACRIALDRRVGGRPRDADRGRGRLPPPPAGASLISYRSVTGDGPHLY